MSVDYDGGTSYRETPSPAPPNKGQIAQKPTSTVNRFISRLFSIFVQVELNTRTHARHESLVLPQQQLVGGTVGNTGFVHSTSVS